MKKLLSITLALLTVLCIFAGCGKSEPAMSELLVGDWYNYNGSPYRSFSEDGIVTGTDNYTSPYTVEGDLLTWNSASGNSITTQYFTDGEILRISSDTGAYFVTRRYFCRSSEGVWAGTGLPVRGTLNEAIIGTWYNGNEIFFTLNENGTVADHAYAIEYSCSDELLVLLTGAASTDEAAEYSLSGDTLTIYYTEELTGAQAELVLTRNPA